MAQPAIANDPVFLELQAGFASLRCEALVRTSLLTHPTRPSRHDQLPRIETRRWLLRVASNKD